MSRYMCWTKSRYKFAVRSSEMRLGREAKGVAPDHRRTDCSARRRPRNHLLGSLGTSCHQGSTRILEGRRPFRSHDRVSGCRLSGRDCPGGTIA